MQCGLNKQSEAYTEQFFDPTRGMWSVVGKPFDPDDSDLAQPHAQKVDTSKQPPMKWMYGDTDNAFDLREGFYYMFINQSMRGYLGAVEKNMQLSDETQRKMMREGRCPLAGFFINQSWQRSYKRSKNWDPNNTWRGINYNLVSGRLLTAGVEEFQATHPQKVIEEMCEQKDMVWAKAPNRACTDGVLQVFL